MEMTNQKEREVTIGHARAKRQFIPIQQNTKILIDSYELWVCKFFSDPHSILAAVHPPYNQAWPSFHMKTQRHTTDEIMGRCGLRNLVSLHFVSRNHTLREHVQ